MASNSNSISFTLSEPLTKGYAAKKDFRTLTGLDLFAVNPGSERERIVFFPVSDDGQPFRSDFQLEIPSKDIPNLIKALQELIK